MKLASCYLMECIFIYFLQAVVKGQWSFSFPKSIKALKNSDVTIPCTFTAPVNHREVNVIWFKYQPVGFPQVFNSKDPSQVIEEYRGRTSLVANGKNSCTLRIKDVTKTEQFYPGISEEINSYELNDKQDVWVTITGCHEDNSCDDLNFRFPAYTVALKGSCVEIPCTFTHPKDAKDFNFFWFSKRKIIFNKKSPRDVADEYKGRTFLTGNAENDCSIKILDVQNSEEYFPGINDDINSIKAKDRKVKVTVKENPPEPSIRGTENMEDKKTVNISCSVDHSCPSNLPTIRWNITGNPIKECQKVVQFLGRWRMESIMTYTASYTGTEKLLGCAATFPNNKTSVKIIALNIKSENRSVILYAGIGAAVGLVIIFVLIVIFCIFRSKKTSHRPPTSQPSYSTYAALQRREQEDEYARLGPGPSGGPITRDR